MLDVQIELRDSMAVMRLKGEFGLDGALNFDSKLHKALEEEPGSVLIDLRGLSFLDSTGLRALIRADARGRREGWQLCLTHAPRTVERIFELTRTDRVFRFVNGADESGAAPEDGPHWEPPAVSDLAKTEVRPSRFPR